MRTRPLIPLEHPNIQALIVPQLSVFTVPIDVVFDFLPHSLVPLHVGLTDFPWLGSLRQTCALLTDKFYRNLRPLVWIEQHLVHVFIAVAGKLQELVGNGVSEWGCLCVAVLVDTAALFLSLCIYVRSMNR